MSDDPTLDTSTQTMIGRPLSASVAETAFTRAFKSVEARLAHEGSRTRLSKAGPMRGFVSSNFPAFHAGARDLRNEGYFVMSPAEMDLENGFDPDDPDQLETFDLESALADDLLFVAKEADGVALLDGWEESKGALAEVATALALGKPVRLVGAWLGEDYPDVLELPQKGAQSLRERALADFARSELIGPTAEDIQHYDKIWKAALPEYPFTTGSPFTDKVERVTSATGGSKEKGVARFDMIPTDSLWELAEHFGKGAIKYEPVNGMDNWRNGYPFSLSYAAAYRHLTKAMSGEDLDPETKSKHVIAVMWHMAVLAHQMNRPSMVEQFDDRQALLEAT